MQFYLGIIIVSFILLGYVLLLKDKFKYNYSTGVFLTLTSIMFFMSICSMLNIMLIGFYAISIIGIILSFIFIIKNIIQKKFKISEIFEPQNLLYLVMFILIVVVARKVYILMDWDECSYWGTIVKRLYYFDSFVGGENFHTFYYPPALSSYQYFIVKILGMQDRSIYFAQYLYMISALIFVIRNIKWKNVVYGILGLLSSFMFLVLLLKPYIFTLYSEIPIILTLACSIMYIVTHENKRDLIFIGMMMANLSLIKSNAFACSLLPVAIIGVSIISKFIDKLKEEKITPKVFGRKLIDTLKENKYYVILMLIPFIAQFCFNMYLKINNVNNIHSVNIGLAEIINDVFNNPETAPIVTNYLGALSSNYTFSKFNLPAMLLISLFIIGFMVLLKIYNKTSKRLEENKFIGIAYFGIFFVYAASLLYSYLFLFSRFEASILASYERYMNAFIGGAGIAFIGIIVYFMQSEDKAINNKMKKFVIVVFLIILSVVNIAELFNTIKLFHPVTKMPTIDTIVLGNDVANYYASYFTPEDKIHIISQGEYGLSIWSTIYYMAPLRIYDPRFEGTMWSIELPGESKVPNSTQVTGEQFIDYLENYNFTHVLVIQTHELFYEQYGEYFVNLPTENSIPEGIYEFNKENRKLEFINY